MKQMIIHGGKPLQGDVWIGGAKNSTVALIPASILSRTPVVLEGVPRIADVINLMDLLDEMDVRCEFKETTLRIDPTDIKMSPLPAGKIKSLRASYYFMGALLGRFGKAVVGFPGGDDIGPRPIDQHIKGFEALGASVKNENDQIIITAPEDGLHGAKIHLKMPSVGATMNIIMASVTAQGQTIIENAAKEPEIIDLATFLNNMGAVIRGAGTDVIRIEGVKKLHGAEYSVIPDQIEAGTFMMAAAATRGDITVKNVIPKHLDCLSSKLREIGCEVSEFDDAVRVVCKERLHATSVNTLPYPGFPTDMQPQMSVVLALARGTSVVTESIFDNRFRYVDELIRMGANIQVESNIAIINGIEQFSGTSVTVPDLRAGAALVIAGLAAQGVSVLEDIVYIKRGYEDFAEKLTSLGGIIEEVETEKDIQRFRLKNGTTNW